MPSVEVPGSDFGDITLVLKSCEHVDSTLMTSVSHS